MTDTKIGNFLASRRKLIAGLLGVVGVLVAGIQGADVYVQAIIGFLGVYGIHEVSNGTKA